MTRAKIHLSVCVSIDGRIATGKRDRSNQEKNGGWTCPEDKEMFRRLCDDSDFLIMGATTYELMPLMGKPVVMISRSEENKGKSVIAVLPPDVPKILAFLDQFQKSTALLCGGAMTYSLFLKAGLVDRITMVVEPVILNRGPVFMDLTKDDARAPMFRYYLRHYDRLGNFGAIKLEYERQNGQCQ